MPIKGDFISFSYNGVHSTDLGIVRVTSSNRYTDQLLPSIQDKTVAVPGGDGTYFFGSQYNQRQISISVAFDEVTEDKIRLMRATFGDRLAHWLIFDDEPYKVYYAKVTGTPQLQYIPFSTPRIYKGEGTFTFVCFDPFAHCPNSYKYKDQWDASIHSPSWYKYNNSDEWNLSAQLLLTQGTYDSYSSATGFKLYNPGDIETDFNFIIPKTNFSSISGIKISNDNTTESKILNVSITSFKGSDQYIQFNSKTNIIEGLNSSGTRTGNLYNEYITAGDWFKIPLTKDGHWFFQPNEYNGGTPTLKYDYLYF